MTHNRLHGVRSLLVVDEDLLGNLEAGMSEMNLVERLGWVESIAVLCADHVSVEVLLSLPGGTIEEVHGRSESASCHGSETLNRYLHAVVVINLVHVGNLLAQVVSRLESRVRESFSSCSCYLSVPYARMIHWNGTFSILVLNAMHSRVGLRYL